jgi:hypothetical protein
VQVRLSVYYHDGFLSYQITSEDKVHFLFELKSAPKDITNPPDKFTVIRKGHNQWDFDREFDQEFKDGVLETMKKTKL